MVVVALEDLPPLSNIVRSKRVAGKTVHEFTNHDTGVFFVMIDTRGWLYTATQAGAYN
eukprot:gene2616-4031_t